MSFFKNVSSGLECLNKPAFQKPYLQSILIYFTPSQLVGSTHQVAIS